ncbi:hypothetical protein NKDENANG_03440 [Candidatus Entotheonellaceae bacterium PAL068K]
MILGMALVSCQSPKQAKVALDPSDAVAIERTYQEGRTAYEVGRYDEAADKFALVVQADTMHTKALINWGVSLSSGGQPLQAIPYFQQAVTHGPNSAEAYYNWGVALERLGKHQEAIEKYEQALALKAELQTPALQRYLQRHRVLRPDVQIGTSPPRSQ